MGLPLVEEDENVLLRPVKLEPFLPSSCPVPCFVSVRCPPVGGDLPLYLVTGPPVSPHM